MQHQNFKIVKYAEKYREQLLETWESSVKATHHFLKPDDFNSIKAFVQMMDFDSIQVYCMLQSDAVVGFIGVAAGKIEMLFLSPKHIGKGLGSILVEFAINELKINKVDVNEGNKKAVKFYERVGFTIFERTEKDDQGKEYPLLRMKLSRS